MSLLRLFALNLVCISLAGVGSASAADAYPVRPVRWVVPYPPGGTTDIVARIIGQRLTERLGQQIVIDNRPGAGNNIGTEAVIKSSPDGYTVLLVNPANAINATLYQNLNFNFLRDMEPVAGLVRVPNVMEVPRSMPAKTVAEFIAYAKANPGKVNMAAPGVGTSQHLSGELFNQLAGLDMIAVQYRGSALGLTDLMGGQVQVMFDAILSSIPHVKSGKLRALAVTAATRSDALPDVQSLADFVPGYEASGWNGIGAPKNTPVEVIDRLNREINAGLADPALRARFADLGGTVLPGSPAVFGKQIADETAKWGRVIRAANIKAE